MKFWIAEHANTIFYGLLIGLALAEVLLRLILKVKKTNVWLEYVDSGFIAIILALIIRTLVLQTFIIPSGSMENTLLIGDQLLVNRFLYGTQIPFTDQRILKVRDPKRGDVLVFRYPKDPKRDFIKRCIGTPGDIIEIKKKVLMVNGEAVYENHALYRERRIIPPELSQRDYYGPVTVPAKHYFMMGDNRDFSADSRFWGFLPKKLIKGKAWVVYWPISRWKTIK